MSFRAKSGEIDESAWIKAYMDLVGVTECQARSVFMYLGCNDFVDFQSKCSPESDSRHAAASNVVGFQDKI